MGTVKNSQKSLRSGSPPARIPENREKQLIEKAYMVAEERLNNGTASAQEIVHFLKLGTVRAELEKQKLEAEAKLIAAKQEAVESAKRSELKYQEAIDAFKLYNGMDNFDE